ncbi:MAG: hypothetical protein ACREBN_08585 [Burkholderiaceae bacterium]
MNGTMRSARLRGVFVIVCGVLATGWATAASAADPAPAPQAQKSAKPKPKPMTRDQLRACMDQQDRVVSMREQLLKRQVSMDQQRNDVGRMDAELERMRATLDPVDAEGAKALSEAEEKRNAVSDAFNAQLPGTRELNANYNQERQSWVERCADKDYDANDEAAIKRERQRAAAKAAPK